LLNSQEQFWKNDIASSYLSENDNFDIDLGVEAWNKMLSKVGISNLDTVLECGSNIGRNLQFLSHIHPELELNVVEISPAALEIVKSRYLINDSFLGSIKNSEFNGRFDLVFTCGVLIHVNPKDLLESMKKIYDHSRSYILIAEYFNRTPVEIEYRGNRDKLFKSDFGKLFFENFDCELLDVGFLWGKIYDSAGFDDVTYWLFKKRP
jgi:pseudaminic acid biosynthesis-associated methylase